MLWGYLMVARCARLLLSLPALRCGCAQVRFNLFLHILQLSAWRVHLPPALNEHLEELVAKFGDHTHGDRVGPGEAVVHTVQALWNGCQMDSDQFIDRNELSRLLRRLANHTGRQYSGLEQAELLDAAMDRYGSLDGDGELKGLHFAGFLQLVASKPWNALLPEDARDHLVLQSHRYRVEYQHRGAGEAEDEAEARLSALAASTNPEMRDGRSRRVYIPAAQPVAGGIEPEGAHEVGPARWHACGLTL